MSAWLWALIKCTWGKEAASHPHPEHWAEGEGPAPAFSRALFLPFETELTQLLWPGPGGRWHRQDLLWTPDGNRTQARKTPPLHATTDERGVSRPINCYWFCGDHFFTFQSVIRICKTGLSPALRHIFSLCTWREDKMDHQPFRFPVKGRPKHFPQVTHQSYSPFPKLKHLSGKPRPGKNKIRHSSAQCRSTAAFLGENILWKFHLIIHMERVQGENKFHVGP